MKANYLDVMDDQSLENKVVARDIMVHYGMYEDRLSRCGFTVRSEEANEILGSILNLLDQYHFPAMGIQMGKNYLSSLDRIANKEQIKEHLLTEIESTIDLDDAYILTRKPQ